uniref:Uncharacterized protein n=1 Tax=Acidobacterium capsulatum TaxID=33075 RepID=A0A7V4XTS7_9BACT
MRKRLLHRSSSLINKNDIAQTAALAAIPRKAAFFFLRLRPPPDLLIFCNLKHKQKQPSESGSPYCPPGHRDSTEKITLRNNAQPASSAAVLSRSEFHNEYLAESLLLLRNQPLLRFPQET